MLLQVTIYGVSASGEFFYPDESIVKQYPTNHSRAQVKGVQVAWIEIQTCPRELRDFSLGQRETLWKYQDFLHCSIPQTP